jgi:hypothetical protein
MGIFRTNTEVSKTDRGGYRMGWITGSVEAETADEAKSKAEAALTKHGYSTGWTSILEDPTEPKRRFPWS